MEEIEEEELRRQILTFLREFKELMIQGPAFYLGHRKNIDTMKILGISARHRDQFILSLAVDNYSSGPVTDKYKPGNIWIFGKDLDGREMYVKLKIATDNHGNDTAVCLSFHPSEYPMKYPLRS